MLGYPPVALGVLLFACAGQLKAQALTPVRPMRSVPVAVHRGTLFRLRSATALLAEGPLTALDSASVQLASGPPIPFGQVVEVSQRRRIWLNGRAYTGIFVTRDCRVPLCN